MIKQLTGSWISSRSDIPGYRLGTERLRFAESGDHEWEVAQPGGAGAPSLTRFRACPAGDVFIFRALRQSAAQVEWTVRIRRVDHGAIAVTPQHGYTTIFVREHERNSERPVSQ